ncbi:ABC transporter [Bacillus sp. UMB0899]|nr:ABC transporter [Bacillus sp. UMB0899]
MIYIYNDYGGTHTTSLAAAYHLNQLPQSERKLTTEEILNVNYFNKLTKKDAGRLIFHGVDEDGNSVYTIGKRREKLVVPALKEMALLLEEKYQCKEKIVISNTSPTVPLVMTLGGFLSRGLKIDFLGVPLLILGAKQCCDNIYRLVEHTKKMGLTENGENVIILENEMYK